jgi:hypothetical protein
MLLVAIKQDIGLILKKAVKLYRTLTALNITVLIVDMKQVGRQVVV